MVILGEEGVIGVGEMIVEWIVAGGGERFEK